MHEESPLDIENLMFEISGNEEVFAELVDTALRDLPMNMRNLKLFAERLELVKVSRTAHTMKTTLAHWGATSALEEARGIDEAAQEGAEDEAIAGVQRLEEKLQPILQALQTLKCNSV